MKDSSSEPLLTHQQNKSYIASQISPIERYNIFIDCYNTPNNLVDGIYLIKMPSNKIYDDIYKLLRITRGKIVLLVINLIPLLNFLLFGMFCSLFFVYWSRIKIHQQNTTQLVDPFKHMIFDPQLCYTLKRDYYFFNIQFKDLQGFTLNYNQQMKKQLHLRRERGKATFMIYNANFWAHYHHYTKWKPNHIYILLFSATIAILSNLSLLFIILY